MSGTYWLMSQYHVHCPGAMVSPQKLQTFSLRLWRKEMYHVSRTEREKHVTGSDGCTECKFSERIVSERRSMCFLQDSMKSMYLLSIHSRYLDCIILTIPRWVEYAISKRAKSLPSEFRNLRDLTLAILREFSSSNLRHSAQGKILSSGAQPKSVETQYQDDFYRCFNKVAGRGVPVCTEWSRTTDGRVDFWIPGQKWAVEIVREQDRINEHIMRFHENGQYYPWRVDGMIQDWIIVNCTTSPPTHG